MHPFNLFLFFVLFIIGPPVLMLTIYLVVFFIYNPRLITLVSYHWSIDCSRFNLITWQWHGQCISTARWYDLQREAPTVADCDSHALAKFINDWDSFFQLRLAFSISHHTCSDDLCYSTANRRFNCLFDTKWITCSSGIFTTASRWRGL